MLWYPINKVGTYYTTYKFLLFPYSIYSIIDIICRQSCDKAKALQSFVNAGSLMTQLLGMLRNLFSRFS